VGGRDHQVSGGWVGVHGRSRGAKNDELGVDIILAALHSSEAPVDSRKAAVDLVEARVDFVDGRCQALHHGDQLLILSAVHDVSMEKWIVEFGGEGW
jgi:hypothetical protein